VFSKNFTIQHPYDEDRYLIHSALEGPTTDVFYRGKVYCDKFVTVKLPLYTNKWINFHVQITPIGKTKQMFIDDIIVENNKEPCFNIHGDDACWVYYLVIAERKECAYDPEPLKKDIEVNTWGPYSWHRKKID
jgi:hypothetical protein